MKSYIIIQMSHHWMWAIFKLTKNLWKKYMSFKMYVIKNVTKCQSLGSNWYRYRVINDRFCIISDQILFCIFCPHTFAQNKVVFKISLFGIIAVTFVVLSENKPTTTKKNTAKISTFHFGLSRMILKGKFAWRCDMSQVALFFCCVAITVTDAC